MPDFHEAIQGAIDTARDVAGVPVRYVRRDETDLQNPPDRTVTAIIGTTKFEKHTQSGVTVMSPARDFLIGADALIVDAEADEPETFDPVPGDLIAHVQGGKRFIYEVMPIDGTKETEWLDTTTDQYRIHTRLVKRQPAGDLWPDV